MASSVNQTDLYSDLFPLYELLLPLWPLLSYETTEGITVNTILALSTSGCSPKHANIVG